MDIINLCASSGREIQNRKYFKMTIYSDSACSCKHIIKVFFRVFCSRTSNHSAKVTIACQVSIDNYVVTQTPQII